MMIMHRVLAAILQRTRLHDGVQRTPSSRKWRRARRLEAAEGAQPHTGALARVESRISTTNLPHIRFSTPMKVAGRSSAELFVSPQVLWPSGCSGRCSWTSCSTRQRRWPVTTPRGGGRTPWMEDIRTGCCHRCICHGMGGRAPRWVWQGAAVRMDGEGKVGAQKEIG